MEAMINRVLGVIRKVVLFVIKWRYLIALIAFSLGVIFQLHGSSINQYNVLFANSEQYNAESIIMGESRAIRSDEWLVNVPYYMSQRYNDYETISDMMSLEGQDMVLGGAGAPVADATILARPFMWGYVILGNEYGLSWYWCSKIILLLLVSFEFCMVLTRKNKKVSLIGMMLLTFAPAMQWWSMLDPYFWGMALATMGYHFFTTRNKILKVACTVFLPFSVVAFVLVLYPAFQWPTGLFLVALLIALLIRDKNIFRFTKVDVLRITGMVGVAIGILAYTFITSKDALLAISGTVYPGAVTALGGNYAIKDLFTDLTSFTLPFKDITYSNNCEISTFVQFAPMLLMLYPVIYKKIKRDRNVIVGNVLVGCLAVMMVFMLAGFPELLSKITLFSYITRMKITYMFAATVFTVWGIDVIWRKKMLTRKSVTITLLICVGLYVCFIGEAELSYLSWWQYGIILVGFMILIYVVLMGHQTLSTIGIVALMIISGATVNPLVHGASALLGHPLEKKIAEIADSDAEAYWISNDSLILSSVGVANGAKMLNMVNFYPDYEKWKLIDPELGEDDVVNRYAHIDVSLTDGETEFSLGETRDVVKVELGCDDALKWPIKYVLTPGELDSCKKDYHEIYSDSEGDYHIYERIYNDKESE